MGRGFYSLIIFLLRQLVITLPLAFLLAPCLGLTGVWISFPIAEAFAAIVSFFIYRNVKNKEILFFLKKQNTFLSKIYFAIKTTNIYAILKQKNEILYSFYYCFKRIGKFQSFFIMQTPAPVLTYFL